MIFFSTKIQWGKIRNRGTTGRSEKRAWQGKEGTSKSGNGTMDHYERPEIK